MHVFVTGGTGLIGTRLVRCLLERQDRVSLLTRRKDVAQAQFAGACTVIEGDPMEAGRWMDAIRDCDAVINLVGENIFSRRWNEDFKRLLRDSRVKSTENVARALSQAPRASDAAVKVLV